MSPRQPVSPRPRQYTSETWLRRLGRAAIWSLSFLYRELLQRNIINPLKAILKEQDDDIRASLMRQWAQAKKDESKYTQLAVSVV